MWKELAALFSIQDSIECTWTYMSAKKYEMKLHVPGLQGIMQNTCDYFYFLSFFNYINYFFWIHIYIYILKLIYEYRAISFVVNHCILHLKFHWSSLARSRCSSISLFVICDRFKIIRFFFVCLELCIEYSNWRSISTLYIHIRVTYSKCIYKYKIFSNLLKGFYFYNLQLLLTSSKQKLGQTWHQEILVLHKEIFGNFILIIAWFIYSHFFEIDKSILLIQDQFLGYSVCIKLLDTEKYITVVSLFYGKYLHPWFTRM